jgi:hypothetical protein
MRALSSRLSLIVASVVIVVILYLGPYRAPRLDS